MATRLSKAYLLTKVLTASNQEVVVYLYEGAIGYLTRAGQALREGRRAEATTAIERAINIVVELSNGLNYNAGGAVALQLDRIYNHLIESLTLANARGSLEAVESCEGILSILHDAWEQAVAAEGREAAIAENHLTVSA